MATSRGAGSVASTRRSLIEAAIEHATAAAEQFRRSNGAPTVEQTIDACCSLLLVERLATSVGSWTEDHFVVELSEQRREKVDWLRGEREAPFRAQIDGRAGSLLALCDAWRGSFGDVRHPIVANDKTEDQRATAYVIASWLSVELTDCCRLRQECRELGLEAAFLQADWPIDTDAFNALAGELREIAETLQDDGGVGFSVHEERRSREGVPLPASLQDAYRRAPFTPWVGARALWEFTNPEMTDSERAIGWRDLALFGLERVQWFADDNPDSDFTSLLHRYGEELWTAIESEEFWFVVSRGFFRPVDWAGRAAALRPVTSHAATLIRLGLDRELKELSESFILGNWIAVMALARVAMERVLKKYLDLPSEAQRPDLETLVNRYCDGVRETGGGDIRKALHRLRTAANDRLHRREQEGWLILRGERLSFDENKLEERARESIDTLHGLFREIDRLPRL